MKNSGLVRAWKDPNYRKSLSNAERNRLPPNPAGVIELSDAQLSEVGGGAAGLIRPIVSAAHCIPLHLPLPHDFPILPRVKPKRARAYCGVAKSGVNRSVICPCDCRPTGLMEYFFEAIS